MRTPDRILIATALGLLSGLSAAWGFEGTTTQSLDVRRPGARRNHPRRSDRCAAAAACAQFRALAVRAAPAAMPNAALPRPTAPVPSVGAPQAAPLGRPVPVPPPTAFAAPTVPITPFEAFRSGARALQAGEKEKALVSLEYAADQGVVAAQWKLGRMYAEGQGVDRSDIKAFEFFSRIADDHPDDAPGTPQARYVSNAFVALGHYYTNGIPNSHVKPDLAPRAPHVPVCGVLLRRCRRAVSSGAA